MAVLGTLLVAPAPSTLAQVQATEAELPWDMKCATAARAMLAEWRTTDEVFRDADEPFGGRVWRLPTDQLGVWVTVGVDPGASPTLARIDGRDTLRVSFGPSCEPSRSVLRASSAAPSGGAYGDDDMTALVGDGRSGVIYVWSPHMPLSVDAYHHVTHATEALGVSLTSLLDPAADADYARRVARAAGIPQRALRPFRSVELVFRNATLHAPSVLVYRNGRMIGLAIPGYRDAAGYRALIETRLEEATGAAVPDP